MTPKIPHGSEKQHPMIDNTPKINPAIAILLPDPSTCAGGMLTGGGTPAGSGAANSGNEDNGLSNP